MVIVISAFATNQNVIEAMKMGAFDFIRKDQLPFNLKIVVDSALKASAELKAANTFKPVLTVEQHQDEIVGRSEPMQQVFKMIGRVAASDAPVMITGESGSGKELVGKGDPQLQREEQQKLSGDQLCGDPGELAGERAFWSRKGVFHGSARPANRAFQSKAIRVHFFSMRLEKCRSKSKARSCACCRRGIFRGWEATKRFGRMCESSAQRTSTSKRRSRKGSSARISFIA